MIVLVTIGSTHFDALVAACCTQDFFRACEVIHCSTVILQLGQGAAVPMGHCEPGAVVPIRNFRERNCAKDLLARTTTSAGGEMNAQHLLKDVVGGEVVVKMDGEMTVLSRRDCRFRDERVLQGALQAALAKGGGTTVSEAGAGATRRSKDSRKNSQLRVLWFRFTPDFEQILKRVDVVICHAGAGSILGAVRCQKKTITVSNPALMDNHQVELARAMAEGGYCRMAESVGDLPKALAEWAGMEIVSGEDSTRGTQTVSV